MTKFRYGGEGVSQSPLKDKAFSTFLDRNPPFELRPENGISPSAKACAPNGVIDDSAIKQLASAPALVKPEIDSPGFASTDRVGMIFFLRP
jgi:hypothetical protein